MRPAMPHNAPASLVVHGVMHRIKTYNAISSKGLDRFELERYEVGQDIANPDALLLRSYKLREDEIPDSLTAIARAGADSSTASSGGGPERDPARVAVRSAAMAQAAEAPDALQVHVIAYKRPESLARLLSSLRALPLA